MFQKIKSCENLPDEQRSSNEHRREWHMFSGELKVSTTSPCFKKSIWDVTGMWWKRKLPSWISLQICRNCIFMSLCTEISEECF